MIDSDGTEKYTSKWYATDYIFVEPGATYQTLGLSKGGSNTYIGLYNSEKEMTRTILMVANENNNFTINENERYVRLSIRNFSKELDTALFYKVNTTIYDISGYGNNGEIIESIGTTSDSPKNNYATHFAATNQKIKISNLSVLGFTNSYSFAWWEKINSVNNMCWGFSDGVRLNGMYTGKLWSTGDGSSNPLYVPGTTTQVATPTANVWHHWVMTGNGTKCLVYQDGELWGEAKTVKPITGTTIYLNGWNETTNYSSSNASMSDFRIYATPLTADQVAQLYRDSMVVDSSGNITPRDLE